MTPFKPEKDALTTMPPPPDPSPAPDTILGAEINGLSTCLKAAAIKTGQIYGFYADTRKLGIEKHAPNPPRSLTASLGREVEKYDQLCDSVEAHLVRAQPPNLPFKQLRGLAPGFQLRAISVLQRDIHREERRLQEVENASIATRTRSKSTSLSPTSARTALPPTSDADISQVGTAHPTPANSPPAPNSIVGPGRRPSAISISSLHRPAFPLKLDLSSTALRITPEEASLFSTGLASPVTLAPKSARPVGPDEFPPELMAAFASSNGVLNPTVDIDLTVSDTDQDNVKMHVDGNVGNSADKPIELDLDSMDISMTDLFGDAPDSNSADVTSTDGLFSPVVGDTNMINDSAVKQEDPADRDFLVTLSPPNNDEDIFATLAVQAGPTPHLPEKTIQPLPSVPSPGALLATFSSSQLQDINSSANNSNISGGETQFDLLDLSNLGHGLFENESEHTLGFPMDMEDFLNMGRVSEEKEGSKQDSA
ncbi:hypothetical protein BDZ94DRAFT_315042 [Collybia nuda]|uniref:Uncharacterized protein n=1 Tax=Collybia nuda TaxID=64659 RepID=A0A9P6CD99_9AGAR|nr:hypothetical protein BDZ94DRAFT_315042 [Collybia nuda]